MIIGRQGVKIEALKSFLSEHKRREEKYSSLAKVQREKEVNEMWAGVAEYFACDGTCPTCILGKEKFRGKHQRKEEERT